MCCRAALDIRTGARVSRGRQRLGWTFLAAVSAGSSIWSTHFIAMLGYKPEVPVTFDPVLTIVSLLIALAGAGIGRAVATSSRRIPALVVRAVLALGKSLGVPILAEGIETGEQLIMLRSEACDEAQGYLLGRPFPLEMLTHGVVSGIAPADPAQIARELRNRMRGAEPERHRESA